MTKTYDCIIIGAGISGLVVASELQKKGKQVAIIEKSRGVGGRMATRRIEDATFDHGAQFFTTRSEEFVDFVKKAQNNGVVSEWCRGFLFPQSKNSLIDKSDDYPRYCGKKGMTSLPKMLAQNLEIHLQQRVQTTKYQDDKWKITTEQGKHFLSKHIVFTAPVPQTLTILSELSIPELEPLKNISYTPCFALMIKTTVPSLIPSPGGIKNLNENIEWVGDNQQKGISSVPSITVHTTPSFTRKYWDTDFDEVAQILLKDIRKFMGGNIDTYEVHRWRYCGPITTYPEKYFAVESPPFTICGDAFAGPKIEGAFLSGLATAYSIL